MTNIVTKCDRATYKSWAECFQTECFLRPYFECFYTGKLLNYIYLYMAGLLNVIEIICLIRAPLASFDSELNSWESRSPVMMKAREERFPFYRWPESDLCDSSETCYDMKDEWRVWIKGFRQSECQRCGQKMGCYRDLVSLRPFLMLLGQHKFTGNVLISWI